MAKPIGNLVANLKTHDKVGFRTKAKFANKALQPDGGTAPPEPGPPAKPKYKTRKK